MNCTDPNYTSMCDIMFGLLDYIFMHRAGQRCTDTDMMIAARAKFAKLWCGGSQSSSAAVAPRKSYFERLARAQGI